MILAIDTSALVLRYLLGEHRELVLEEMEKAKNSGGKSTGPPKVPSFARNARPK